MHKLALSLAIAMVSFSLFAAPMPPVEKVTISEHGPLATLLHVSGQGTAKASFSAQVSLDDLKQDCLGHDVEGSPECSLKALRQQAADQPVFHASADCLAHRLTTDTMDSSFERRDGSWINLSPGAYDDVVLDGSNASGAAVLDIQFSFLCPDIQPN